MPARARHAVFLLVLLAAACSSVPYVPRPLDPDAATAEYAARSGNAAGLARFAAANGYPQAEWPPQQWRLRELTLAALYFHPDMDVARARADVARAQQSSAGARSPLGVRLAPEHHSRELDEDNGPWTLGLELEIPLTPQGRREAQVERSAFEADAADLDVAAAAWQVRARVRDRLDALQAAQEAVALLQARLQVRQEMLALVQRRVEAGMLSAHELGAETLALSQLEVALAQESVEAQHARAQLAPALGLPVDVVSAMQLQFDRPPAAVAAGNEESRRLALRNRLDVHRKLLEFGAADAEVKLAVASQNPEITLGPGYAWDQGDNVWSLAVGFTLPPAALSRARVRESEAKRELAAQQFIATQTAAIAGAQAASAQYRASLERTAAAQRQFDLQRAQEARVVRQFDAGGADRLQRSAAKVGTLAAQEALRAAQVESRRALAGLEDAVQRPLAGDFDALPDMRAAGRNDERIHRQ